MMESPRRISRKTRKWVSRCPAMTQFPASPGIAVAVMWPGPRRRSSAPVPSTTYSSAFNRGRISLAIVSPGCGRKPAFRMGSRTSAGTASANSRCAVNWPHRESNQSRAPCKAKRTPPAIRNQDDVRRTRSRVGTALLALPHAPERQTEARKAAAAQQHQDPIGGSGGQFLIVFVMVVLLRLAVGGVFLRRGLICLRGRRVVLSDLLVLLGSCLLRRRSRILSSLLVLLLGRRSLLRRGRRRLSRLLVLRLRGLRLRSRRRSGGRRLCRRRQIVCGHRNRAFALPLPFLYRSGHREFIPVVLTGDPDLVEVIIRPVVVQSHLRFVRSKVFVSGNGVHHGFVFGAIIPVDQQDAPGCA